MGVYSKCLVAMPRSFPVMFLGSRLSMCCQRENASQHFKLSLCINSGNVAEFQDMGFCIVVCLEF
jgi:hypothetical protein